MPPVKKSAGELYAGIMSAKNRSQSLLLATFWGLCAAWACPAPAQARYAIRAEIDIDAAPERTWAALTDLAAWADWNPFIRSARGELRLGSLIDVVVQPSGTKPISGKGRVLVLDPPRQMVWAATLLGSWVFRGEHRFAVEPLPGGKSRFVQSEEFTGLLVPFLRGKIDRETKRGFVEMNAALKRRVEGASVPPAAAPAAP
jgi:hypothetical protein